MKRDPPSLFGDRQGTRDCAQQLNRRRVTASLQSLPTGWTGRLLAAGELAAAAAGAGVNAWPKIQNPLGQSLGHWHRHPIANGRITAAPGKDRQGEIAGQPLQFAKVPPAAPVYFGPFRGQGARFQIAANRCPTCNRKYQAVTVAKLNMAKPGLSKAKLGGAEVYSLPRIAGDFPIRNAGHIFHQPPIRIGGEDAAPKLFQHGQAVARRFITPGRAEILAGRAADDTGGHATRRRKVANVATPKPIRATQDCEARSFKAAV